MSALELEPTSASTDELALQNLNRFEHSHRPHLARTQVINLTVLDEPGTVLKAEVCAPCEGSRNAVWAAGTYKAVPNQKNPDQGKP
jgi:hypothetical protein